jgi:glutamine amidotransferase
MIAVIDFGMGNLRSVLNALEHLGANPHLVTEPEQLARAERIILPGVGSYYRAMENIRARGLERPLKERVLEHRVPLLGICIGMQIMGRSGTEDGFCQGLGLIDCPVEKFAFDPTRHPELKIPHVGFNTVSAERESALFDGLGDEADFYFTHSYRMTFTRDEAVVGSCWHGEHFVAAVQRGHICGTQFHPEKSQANGLRLLRNFLENFSGHGQETPHFYAAVQ